MFFSDRAARPRSQGQSEMARALSEADYRCSQSTVRDWLRRGYPSAEAVPILTRLTGVPRWRLRPDLWEPPEAGSDAPDPEGDAEGPAERDSAGEAA